MSKLRISTSVRGTSAAAVTSATIQTSSGPGQPRDMDSCGHAGQRCRVTMSGPGRGDTCVHRHLVSPLVTWLRVGVARAPSPPSPCPASVTAQQLHLLDPPPHYLTSPSAGHLTSHLSHLISDKITCQGKLETTCIFSRVELSEK